MNLFLLAGAGFSSPYLKNGEYSLSTKFLTEVITDENTFLHWFRKIYDCEPSTKYLKIIRLCNLLLQKQEKNFKDGYWNGKINPTFETIIYSLENILNFKNDSHFLGKVVLKLKNNFNDLNYSIRDLLFVKQFLLDVSASFHAQKDDLELLVKYFTRLISEYNVKFYTLNYDNLIVEVFNEIARSNNDFTFVESVNTGIINETNGLMEPYLIFSNKFESKPHSMLFLHGSANYNISSHKFTFNYHNGNTSIEEMEAKITNAHVDPYILNQYGAYRHHYSMISGYEKGIKISYPPYSTLFARCQWDYLNADEILVIGYSWMDDHINSILQNVRQRVKKIQLVDFNADKSARVPGYIHTFSGIFGKSIQVTSRDLNSRANNIWSFKSDFENIEVFADLNGTKPYIAKNSA